MSNTELRSLSVTGAGSVEIAAQRPVSLRLAGRLRVLEALNAEHGLSRLDLGERTGLARATVTSIVADLTDQGIVVDAGPAWSGDQAARGRPPRLVRLAPDAGYAIGLDIARDHLRAMLCDMAGTPLRDTDPVPFGVEQDPGAALARAGELVDEVAREVPPDRILGLGVGIASPVDRRTGAVLSEAVLPNWLGIAVAEKLAESTGLRVDVINDANAALLAERRFGAARDVDDVIYLRLSAGIGAGIVSNGRMVLGAAGVSGELGHMTVDPDGAICRCGNRGCLETVANPAAIAALVSTSLDREVTTADLLGLVTEGHRAAVRAVGDAGMAIGRALAEAVLILNPSLVVVGGELADAGETLFAPMRQAMARNCMEVHSAEVQILPGRLGGAAGARGAATLVLDDAPRRLAALAEEQLLKH